jgi:hypothetical protein
MPLQSTVHLPQKMIFCNMTIQRLVISVKDNFFLQMNVRSSMKTIKMYEIKKNVVLNCV